MRYQFRPILKRERKSLIFRMNCFENNVTFAVHNILREKDEITFSSYFSPIDSYRLQREQEHLHYKR